MSNRRRRLVRPQEKGVTEVSQVRPGQDPRGRPRTTSATETYTLFTQIGGNRLLYSAEEWVRVNLRLETAGPVAVSTRQDVVPALSGKGILLEEDAVEFVLSKGDRLFYTAEAVNRVRWIVEPIPFLESVLRNLEIGFDRTVRSLSPLRFLGQMLGNQAAPPNTGGGDCLPTGRRR